MRAPALLAVAAIVVPGVAMAQPSVSDGVQALVRGDLANAARILTPLAEETAAPDPVAQFFLATMYDVGLGVPADRVRACGLYLQSATPTNPFMPQALALAEHVHMNDPGVNRDCVAASMGRRRTPAGAFVSPGTDRRAGVDRFGFTTGVAALLDGDYPQAFEILRPIAERWPGIGDPAAQFFLAAMYANGLGVPQDPVRACALYVRGAFEPPDARDGLAPLHQALLDALRQTLSEERLQRCLLLATIGFEHGFEPALFPLEPGQWVDIALGADGVKATVAYNGTERDHDLGLVAGAVVFLPVEHTELATGPLRSARRHFIEFFTWFGTALPAPASASWTLLWRIYEVAGPELVEVAVEDLLTASGDRPPSVDVRELARLQVTDAGIAQWAVLTGPDPRSGGIPSAAERQEVEQQAQARKAAEARVDWTAVRDASRAPHLAYADSEACGDLFVYGWSADRTEAMTVQADRNLLPRSTGTQTFDLARFPTALRIEVHVFERPLRAFPFCHDVSFNRGRDERWSATGGMVTIALSPPGVRANPPDAYRASIQIVGAEFVNAAGTRVRQRAPIVLTGIAGGF